MLCHKFLAQHSAKLCNVAEVLKLYRTVVGHWFELVFIFISLRTLKTTYLSNFEKKTKLRKETELVYDLQ